MLITTKLLKLKLQTNIIYCSYLIIEVKATRSVWSNSKVLSPYIPLLDMLIENFEF